MDAPVPVRDLKQSLHVGGAQFCILPVIQNVVHNGVVVPQLFQYLRPGCVAGLGFLSCREHQLLKQHLPQLLGGIDIEWMTCKRVHARFHIGNQGVQGSAVAAHRRPVDLEPDLLHVAQD